MKNIIIGSVLILSQLGLNSAFAAGSVTGTQKATATLSSFCSISATDLIFGDITASSLSDIGQKLSINSNLSILCTKNSAYTIAMGVGNYFSFDRHVREPSGDQIVYHIAPDSEFQQYWYTYGSDNYRVAGTGTGAIQTIPVYGSINKGFYKPANYSDTISVTIYY